MQSQQHANWNLIGSLLEHVILLVWTWLLETKHRLLPEIETHWLMTDLRSRQLQVEEGVQHCSCEDACVSAHSEHYCQSIQNPYRALMRCICCGQDGCS